MKIYVFAYIQDDFEAKKAEIFIIGYRSRDYILKLTPVLGRRAGSEHFNYEIAHDEMKPIQIFYDKYQKHLPKNSFEIPINF